LRGGGLRGYALFGLALLVLLAMMSALTSGCGRNEANRRATGETAESPAHSPTYSVIVAASRGGVAVLHGSHGRYTTFCYDKRHRRVWSLEGGWLVVSADLPRALISPIRLPAGSPFERGAFVVSRSGTMTSVKSMVPVVGIVYTKTTLIYAESHSDCTRVVVCRNGVTRSLAIPGKFKVVSASAKPDGSLLAVVRALRSRYEVCWISVRNGRPSMLAAESGTHAFVTFASRGDFAVLGGFRPCLVDLKHHKRIRLAAQYASTVELNGTRVFVADMGVANGRKYCRAEVLDMRGQTLVSLNGIDSDFVHVDSGVNYVSYVNDSGSIIVRSLRGQAKREIVGSYDDAALVGRARLVAVTGRGDLRYLRNPLCR